MSERYALLAVGGGPAGLAAARGYRAEGGTGRVAIVADEHRLPYRRPPLTKELLRGELEEAELPIEDEAWLAEQQVELVSGRAVRIDPGERTVVLSGGRQLAYEASVIATGAEPTRLPVPGADHPRVRTVRTLDDVRELERHLGPTGDVAVLGSGFIGCEIASSLRLRGHPVELVSDEALPNAARLGDAAGERLRAWLEDDGVALHLGHALERIACSDGRLVLTAGDARVEADVVVMATGVRPRAELAETAGLTPREGAVPVDAGMRTARDRLWAAGDVCLADNAAAGRPLHVEHWGEALAQGEIAGRNAAGASRRWDAVPGFWSTIGRRTLKYVAWGDGFDVARLEERPEHGFTIWYGRDGQLVGALTHGADDDYERAGELIASGAAWT